jgi:outer membrane protein OmpA-like peptidoglycan-associated protein
MTKKPTLRCLPVVTGALSVAIALLSGCGTTSQPERSIQPVSKEERPEGKGESPSPDISSQAEHNAVTAVDKQSSIFFSQGSSALSQSEKGKLQRAAILLKEDRRLSVKLIGHANENGSRSFNLAVADARVESVSASLKKLGVKARQIKKSVVGSEKLPNACRSAECRQQMRRVELVFSKAK